MGRQPKKLEGINEFRCDLCSIYWSTFLEDNTECINSKSGDGVHSFDFAKPLRRTKVSDMMP